MELLPSLGIDYSPRKSKSITAYVMGRLVWQKDNYQFKITDITWVTCDRKEFAMGEW
jgi:hypothetical protein